MLKIKESEVVKNSKDLWEYLQNKGGLDLNYYDKGIMIDLRNILGFSQKKKFEEELQSKEISIELFLHSFFNALSPFSQMYSDLLKLFENGDVKETNESVLIKFDFQSEMQSLEFDLAKFKVWIKKMNSIKANLNFFEINQENLWGLSGVFSSLVSVDYTLREVNIPHTQETKKWIELYESSWPNVNYLILPKTKNKKLNGYLTFIEMFLNDMIQKLSLLRIERSELYSYSMEVSNLDNDDIRHYAWMEVDLWTRSFLENYLLVIDKINNKSSVKAINLQDELSEKLEIFLNTLPQKNIDVSTMVEELEDFLQLPIWKKRYDFYSVWVLTQISEALNNKMIDLISKNGVLCFSFAGSLLAETKSTPSFQVWSELKSYLENPVGKGRKRGIQPDYSILKSPVHNIIDSTVLVVECKQYRKQSKRNFTEALIDYAKGRPSAVVVLVNYGPASNKILNDVDEILKSRTHIIGNMRPGNTHAIKEFRDLIIKATNITQSTALPSLNENILLDENIDIKLTWGRTPRDLDLYIFKKGLDNKYKVKVDYNNRKSFNNEESFIELSEDITQGFGPEIIKIKKLTKGNYLLAVNNYSKEHTLSSSEAKIDIKIKDKNYIFHCPLASQGEWWVLLELKDNKKDVIIHNRIVESISEFEIQKD